MKTAVLTPFASIVSTIMVILAFFATLAPSDCRALTISDPFTNSASWGAPFTEPGKNMVVTNGRMNFTSSTLAGGGAGLARSSPLLVMTQSWSVKVDVHVDPFTILSESQGVSVFLGVGKTSDYLGTHVILDFGRDWWDPNYYGVNDDFQVNGVSVPGFTNVNLLPSSDATLRLDYNAGAQTISFYYDVDGPMGGSGWTWIGTTNIASGTYNLQLGPSDTLSVLLAGWSAQQVVTNGQAYLDNLEITVIDTGSVQVNLSPAGAISAGAQWRVDGGPWQNSGSTVADLAPGNHTISYKSASGWDTPGDQTVTISAGVTTVTNGVYLPQFGTLQVALTPSGAVSAGAQWQVDGGAWQNSGAAVGGLSPGTHAVAYKPLPGWSAPCSHNVLIVANTVTATNGAYAAVDFSYTTNAGAVTITGYLGGGTALNIPATINCQPVTAIAAGAFGVFPPGSPITSVVIPDTVTSIGDQAFQGCNNLTNVSIGSNVTQIGNAAFDFCLNLPSVTLPNSVQTIGDYAFFNNAALTNVTVGSGLVSIGTGAFGYSAIKSVALPNSLKSIGASAFRDCANLTNVALGNGLTNLGNHAFANSSALGHIVIPGGVSVIGNAAFESSALTNVTLGGGITQIGAQAFRYCVNLTTITIPASVTTIGDSAFEFCPSLVGLYFRGNAPTLGGSLTFHVADNSIIYLLPGTTGWAATYGGRPTALWQPRLNGAALNFGGPTNPFGFEIGWASGQTIVTEAATNLANPVWQPLKTNALVTDSVQFNDLQWTNHPQRYYRVRSP